MASIEILSITVRSLCNRSQLPAVASLPVHVLRRVRGARLHHGAGVSGALLSDHTRKLLPRPHQRQQRHGRADSRKIITASSQCSYRYSVSSPDTLS